MYGILTSFAILLCLFDAEKLIKKQKIDLNLFWGWACYLIIGAIIGARLFHILSYFSYYLDHPLEMIQIYKGGLGIYGALFGGLLVSFIYLRVEKQNVLLLLDLAAVYLPLGQAIGRWGNYFNHELFGLPTTLPWGINIPVNRRPEKYQFYDIYHPLFLYESLLDFFLFAITYYIYYKKLHNKYKNEHKNVNNKIYFQNGFFLNFYFFGYGIIRFFLEFLRIDSWTIYDINVAQSISLLLIAIGLININKLNKKTNLKMERG